jgi:hypothetical protein
VRQRGNQPQAPFAEASDDALFRAYLAEHSRCNVVSICIPARLNESMRLEHSPKGRGEKLACPFRIQEFRSR